MPLSPAALARNTERVRRTATPLPGLSPYTNVRAMAVEGRFDRLSLEEFLRRRHPHIPDDTWARAAAEGRLRVGGRSVNGSEGLRALVRSGCIVTHEIPNTVEPIVDAAIAFLYEDDQLIGLHKPAPLPVHPCGRFNRHSVVALLEAAFEGATAHPVHRLDADTTGIMVLAKNKGSARALSRQFEARTVRKRYLALVEGEVGPPKFHANAAVGRTASTIGKRELDNEAGLTAHTTFERLHVANGHSFLLVTPHSGRTNQIRVHLASLGHPIVGDQAYGGASEPAFTSEEGRLHLHAWQLQLRHPTTHEPLALESPPPAWAMTRLASSGHERGTKA